MTTLSKRKPAETYARILAMATEAKVPGKTARDRMVYLVNLTERHGLDLVAQEARPTTKPMEHC